MPRAIHECTIGTATSIDLAISQSGNLLVVPLKVEQGARLLAIAERQTSSSYLCAWFEVDADTGATETYPIGLTVTGVDFDLPAGARHVATVPMLDGTYAVHAYDLSSAMVPWVGGTVTTYVGATGPAQ